MYHLKEGLFRWIGAIKFPFYFCQWDYKRAQHISLGCAAGGFYFLFFKGELLLNSQS
jgi:hypothetical protein